MTMKQSFFNDRAETWEEENPVSREELDRVMDICRVKPGHVVLDVGTGTGRLVPRLLDLVGAGGEVWGVDPSSGMLRVARRRHQAHNLHFVEARAEELPFSNSTFDRVICYAVYPHFSCAASAVDEIDRVLGHGGCLAIVHTRGREALNALHSEAGAAVEEDRLPPVDCVTELLEENGLEVLKTVDERDFYAVKAKKPSSG